MLGKGSPPQDRNRVLVLKTTSQATLVPSLRRIWAQASAISLGLLIVRLPEVFFLGGSLRLTDFHLASIDGSGMVWGWTSFFVSLGLVSSSVQWWSARYDLGGGIWQSEPAMSFMADSLSSHSSPFWNPLLGNGALGPESLVDLKFSILSLISIALGNTSSAHTLAIVFLMWASTACLFTFVRSYLNVGAFAGTVAVASFSLNGFALATISTNYGQVYWMLPIVLLVFSQLLTRTTPLRLTLATTVSAAFFSFTFLPTLITGSFAIVAVLAASFFPRDHLGDTNLSWNRKGVFSSAVSFVLGFFLVSPIYIPMFASLGWTGMLSKFETRGFSSLNFPELLPNLISPSLFLESYNSVYAEPGGIEYLGGQVFHLGIAFSLMAAASLALKSDRATIPWYYLAIISLVFIRLIAGEGLGNYISQVPIFGTIGTTYWWPAIMLPFSLLVAIGANRLNQGRAAVIPASILLLVVTLGIVWSLGIRGLLPPNEEIKTINFIIFFSVAMGIFTLILFTVKSKTQRHVVVIPLILFISLSHSVLDSKLYFPKNPELTKSQPESVDSHFLLPENAKTVTISSDLKRYPSSNVYDKVRDMSILSEGGSAEFQKYFHKAFEVAPEYQHLYSEVLGHGVFPTLHHAGNDMSKYNFNFELINRLGANYFFVPSHFDQVALYLESNGLKIIHSNDKWLILENPNALPNAYALESSKFSITNSYVTTSPVAKSDVARVSLTSRDNSKVVLQLSTPIQKLVVLSENISPGWSVIVNGITEEILTVDKTFRGVIVAPGTSLIEFHYSPPLIGVTYVMFVVGILSIFALISFSSIRRLGASLNKSGVKENQ